VREGDRREVTRVESTESVTEEWIVTMWNSQPGVQTWEGTFDKVMQRRVQEVCRVHHDRAWWRDLLTQFARTPSQDEKPPLLDNALVAGKKSTRPTP
jgi:hypothetical protein